MKIDIATAVLVLIALLPPPLEAGVIPGVWAKVEAIPEGYPVVVELQGGEKLRGLFGTCGPDEISVRDETDEEQTIPKSHVVKITSQEKTENDSLAQGAIIGALVGGLVSIPGAIAALSDDAAAAAASTVLLGTGIGAGVGVATDAVIKGPEVFYRAAKK